MMELELFPVTAMDVVEFERSLDRAELGQFMNGWTPSTVVDNDWSKEACLWNWIVVGGERIGVIWIERRSMNESRIADLGILISDPARRGKGYGGRAIELAEAQGREEWKLEKIRLRVRASNQVAISCYKRANYEETERTTKESRGQQIEVIHMEHVLVPPKGFNAA